MFYSILYNTTHNMLCNRVFLTCYITWCDITLSEHMLRNILYDYRTTITLLLPWSGSASVQCPFIKELLGGCMLIIGEGHATLRAGLLQALLWGKEPRSSPWPLQQPGQ